MDRSETETLIKQFYAARVGGDMEALGALFADGAKFTVAGSPAFSILATAAEGHEAVLSLLQTMTDSFVLEDFAVLESLIDGNKAAVRWRANVNVITAGQTYETELADFFVVEGGKLTSVTEFLDTALAG